MSARKKNLSTLAIDCGGHSIKGSVLNSTGEIVGQMLSERTPYPLSPTHLLRIIEGFLSPCYLPLTGSQWECRG